GCHVTGVQTCALPISIIMGFWFFSCPAQKYNELALRYNSPATMWEETLPLGNGRIGMMPDGGVDSELIVLNDISMWSGSEDPAAFNPTAFDHLAEIRKLLLSGKNLDAQNLMYAHFRSGGLGSAFGQGKDRSEEHTSELQSRENLVCRLLLEKKKDGRGLAG